MPVTARKLKTATDQLTLDFSRPARASNVVQLADHRKAPAERSWAAHSWAARLRAVLETSVERDSDDHQRLERNLDEAIDAVKKAQRGVQDGLAALREYEAGRKRGRD